MMRDKKNLPLVTSIGRGHLFVGFATLLTILEREEDVDVAQLLGAVSEQDWGVLDLVELVGGERILGWVSIN